MLRVRLFGELSVEVDGREIEPPRGARARGVLVWLALNPGLHPRSRVAGRFWPDVLEESARGSLRRTLSDLRRALGPEGAGHLVAERDRIGLPDDEAVWVDAREFERLIAAGRPAEAIELCDGELCAELGDEWALEARDEHAERLGELLGRLAAEARDAGHHADAVALARRRAGLDPLSEEAGRDLVAALAAAGDRSGALAAFERLRERLAGELRLAPSAETQALVEEVRQGSPVAPSSARTDVASDARADAPDPQGAARGSAASGQVSGARRDRRPPPLPRPLERIPGGAFVGRERQLAQLRGALDRAGAGERRVVVVAGEAGIGKTRLVAELCRAAHADGAAVLYGRCYEDSAPYEPFVEALRGYVAGGDPDGLRRRAGPGADQLARLVPELGPPVDTGHAVALGDPDAARYRLFDAIDSLLGSASGTLPAVLALDDLHWADPATLTLLRHLARSPSDAPLLVVLTYRLGEGASREASGSLLPELRGADRLERMILEGLAEAEVGAIAAERTQTAASVELADALWSRTEGNPFFCEELLRRLREAGIDEPAQAAAAVTDLDLPHGVREVIERRLRRLAERARRALATASVLGREFTLEQLEAVDDGDEDLLDALDAALEAELVDEVPGAVGAYSFTHSLVNETLYSGLSAARRARLHAAVADALERIGGEGSPEHAAELARHLDAAGPAGDGHRLVGWSAEAGERAMERLAYEDAVEQYGRAVGGLDALARSGSEAGVAPQRRAELLVALGEAQLRAGRAAPARETFAAAAEDARSPGAPELLARAALGFGGLGVTILEVNEAIVGLLDEALAALGDEDSALRARVMARLAVELYYETASRERSEALGAEAVEVARRLGDEEALVYALNARHVSLWRCDRLEERLGIAREMVALAERAGDREGELQGRNWLVTDLFEAGEIDELDGEIDAYERLAMRLRLPAYGWYAPLWRGALAALRGNFDEVEPRLLEAERIGGLAGDPNVQIVEQVRIGVQTMGGEFETVEATISRVGEGKLPDSPASFSFRCGLVFHNALLGREAEAREHFDHVRRHGLDRMPFDVNWLETVGAFGETCAMLGEDEWTARLYELLLPYEDRHEAGAGRALVSWGAATRHLGVMAAALDRYGESERHFEAALGHNERLGFSPWLVWTRCQYAGMLLARGGPGDGERAESLMAAADDLAGELGLDGLTERIAALRSALTRGP